MTLRELVLAGILLLASACVVVGVALLSVPVAWITAGVLLAALGVLFLVEAGS